MIAFLREFNGAAISVPMVKPPFKPDRAQKQHAAFVKLIRGLGLEVELLKPSADLASIFLRDVALLLPEVAVVTSSTASGQTKEDAEVFRTLSSHRPMQRLGEAGLINGEDILRIGRTLYAAQTRWTNTDGISELTDIVRPFGYEVRTVELHEGLHLATACTFIPPHFLLLNPAWVDASAFGDCTPVPVDESEPSAANTLTLADTTLVSSSFPKTEQRLRKAGIQTQAINIAEFEKTEGRLTRLLLVKEPRETRPVAPHQGLKAVRASKVPEPSGHAAQAIVHGNTVYASAQKPFDPSSEVPPRMSVEEQAEHVLRNVAAVLAKAGSSLANVLHATVHLADPKHLERIEPVYARAFADHRPTRTVIPNRALPPGVLVEIEVIAAVAKGSHT